MGLVKAAYAAALLALATLVVAQQQAGTGGNSSIVELDALMPPHPTDQEDEYLCTTINLPDKPMKLVGIEPLAEMGTVHHMLLFGCKEPAHSEGVWPCRMISACKNGGEDVLYGWGKNAPAVHLPQGVGFSVGPGTSTRTVVLQVHYLALRAEDDASGVRLRLTQSPVPYSAGLAAYAAAFSIPPRKRSTLVKNECCFSGFQPMYGFAFRVHTHSLGQRVFLEQASPVGGGKWGKPRQVVTQDPQQPQGFYPIEPQVKILPGDRLRATCDFNSKGMDRTVEAGHTSADEMCNLYLMSYSELPFFMWCVNDSEWVQDDSAGGVPLKATLVPETQTWAPPSHFDSVTLPSAPDSASAAVVMPLGQVAGISIVSHEDDAVEGGAGRTVWAFHRAFRTWTSTSFSPDGRFTKPDAIRWPTLLRLDRETGALRQALGADTFFLPHMVSPAQGGGLWVVDTALHQVFKLNAEGKTVLTVGKRLTPGSTQHTFCQPTHAIEGRDGAVYVADGYCNSRVVKLSSRGEFLKAFELPPAEGGQAPLPHSIALDECRRRLYVADREAGRVVLMNADSGNVEDAIDVSAFGLPYAVRLGPYGSVLVLAWDRDGTDTSHLLAITSFFAARTITNWTLEGVRAPHDFEIVPAPLSATGTGERLLAVLVAESAPSDNTIKKFVLRTDGHIAETAPEGVVAHAGDHASGGADDQPAGLGASHAGHISLKPIEKGGDELAVAHQEHVQEEVQEGDLFEDAPQETEVFDNPETGPQEGGEGQEAVEPAPVDHEAEQEELVPVEEHASHAEHAQQAQELEEKLGVDAQEQPVAAEEAWPADMDLDSEVPQQGVESGEESTVPGLLRSPMMIAAIGAAFLGVGAVVWSNSARWRHRVRGYRPAHHVA